MNKILNIYICQDKIDFSGTMSFYKATLTENGVNKSCYMNGDSICIVGGQAYKKSSTVANE